MSRRPGTISPQAWAKALARLHPLESRNPIFAWLAACTLEWHAYPAHRYRVGNPGREAFHLIDLSLREPAHDIGRVRDVLPCGRGCAEPRRAFSASSGSSARRILPGRGRRLVRQPPFAS